MMSFKDLCKIFEELDRTSSRNEMAQIISREVGNLDENELQIFSYMVQGRVAPMFVDAEFNLSEKGLLNALEGKFGEDVRGMRAEMGDLGLVVEPLLGEGDKKGLMLSEVYDLLWQVVNSTGKGSVEHKSSIYIKVLSTVSGLEGKYFTKILLGNLRLGCSIKTLLDGYSLSISDGKELRGLLDFAYGSCADIGYISWIVKQAAPEVLLKSVHPLPGVPVLSRLVERVKSFEEVGERFGNGFIVQPKYDGLRCQIHKMSGVTPEVKGRVWYGRLSNQGEMNMFGGDVASRVKLFTRNLEDITDMFPEVVASIEVMPVDSVILDSEIVGWDSGKKVFLSYQDTMTRRRKYGVGEKAESVPVNAFVFDILYLDGKSLLKVESKQRFDMVSKLFEVGSHGDIQISPSEVLDTVVNLKASFSKYISMGLEGVIIKALDSLYIPGVRNFEWVKIKKSIDSKLVDTVDLVVLGYYFGSGKRSRFGIGAILGGVYNNVEMRYESVVKIGTGVTDTQWVEIKARLDSLKVPTCPKDVLIEDLLVPDVYVNPEVVITVDADEISINRSSQNIAKGLSLRFPRLVEFDRADKGVDDITTVSELASMAKS